MPVKLSTTLEKTDKIENIQNRFLIKQYHKFMDSTGASEGNVLRVPIYVMVFGLIGGYIRYLYKTSNLIDEVKEKINKSKSQTSGDSLNDKNTQIEGTKNLQIESQDRMTIFYESLKDIAFFSLAPLLAIAVYFLIFAFGLLSGDNAIYTQAVISFSIGLVTEDVIRTLIRFTQERLSDNNSKSNDK